MDEYRLFPSIEHHNMYIIQKKGSKGWDMVGKWAYREVWARQLCKELNETTVKPKQPKKPRIPLPRRLGISKPKEK